MSKRTKEVNNERRRKKMKQTDRCSIPKKKKRIKQFTEDLVEEYGFDNCGCKKCNDWYKTLYDLSSKIYLSYDSCDKRYDTIEGKESDKLFFAKCLTNPSFLLKMFGKETDSGSVIDFSKSSTKDFIKTIVNTYDFLTLKEKEYFGENVLAIKSILNCSKCKKEDVKKEKHKELELSF